MRSNGLVVATLEPKGLQRVLVDVDGDKGVFKLTKRNPSTTPSDGSIDGWSLNVVVGCF